MLKNLKQKTKENHFMSNISLKDTTTLESLFSEANTWENMPISSLTEEQVALINLKKAVYSKKNATKNGGSVHSCFICVTGV